MGNLSIGFHLVSLLALIGLCFWNLYLQSMLKLWRTWGVPNSTVKIVVGEPIELLRKFACAIEADFTSDLSGNSLPPGRVKLTLLFDLHRTALIKEIKVTHDGGPTVRFVIQLKTDTIKDAIQVLSQDLGLKVLIESVAGS